MLEQLAPTTQPAGQFVPPSREGTVIFPGFDGGGEWGGAAFDPETGLLYVNANEMPWILTMVDVDALGGAAQTRGSALYAQHCVDCHGVDRAGDHSGCIPAWSTCALGRRATRRSVIREGRARHAGVRASGVEDVDLLVELLHDDTQRTRQPAMRPDATAARPRSAREPSELERQIYGSAGRRYSRYVHTGYSGSSTRTATRRSPRPGARSPRSTSSAASCAGRRPLGDLPQARAHGDPPTGAENYGGPVVTAGGLVFIAATMDEKLRAFDKRTGELLWTTTLPAGGYATPAVYEAGGRQFVVIAAGGGKMGTPSGDSYLAYRLP